MCPVYPCPPWHAASTFFAAITVMAFLLPLPPTPRDHMLKAVIIWLLMQFCNDRDHNQRDFDYGLSKMRQRLLFIASPCHYQSYDFLALPEVRHNLRFPGTAPSHQRCHFAQRRGNSFSCREAIDHIRSLPLAQWPSGWPGSPPRALSLPDTHHAAGELMMP